MQILGAAFNPMASMLVPDFIQQYRPAFPVGYTSREATLEYLQHPAIFQLYVPAMVFIDRKGMIRHQYLGDDPFFNNSDKNLRDTIESMLRQPEAPRKRAPAAKKKAS